MPERPHLITIRTSHGLTAIPWDSRDALLDRIRRDPSTRMVLETLTTAGVTQPPDLGPDQLRQLFEVLDEWLLDAGEDAVPEGILGLWSTLARELTSPRR
jgi:hypothetical protein